MAPVSRKRPHSDWEFAVSPPRCSKTAPSSHFQIPCHDGGLSSDNSSSSRADSSGFRDGANQHESTCSSDPPSSPSSVSSSSNVSRLESEEAEDPDLEDVEGSGSRPSLPKDSLPFVPQRPRPQTRPINNSALLMRISSFLPRLKAANENLERDIAAGNWVVMDEVDENSENPQYIEMNLGLGVLEERRPDDSSESESGSEESVVPAPEVEMRSFATPGPIKQRETNVLDKLMGKKVESRKPDIEEVNIKYNGI